MQIIEPEQCIICFESVNRFGTVTRQCSCQGLFHEKCWQQWLIDNHTCPFCRKSYPVLPESMGIYECQPTDTLRPHGTINPITTDNNDIEIDGTDIPPDIPPDVSMNVRRRVVRMNYTRGRKNIVHTLFEIACWVLVLILIGYILQCISDNQCPNLTQMDDHLLINNLIVYLSQGVILMIALYICIIIVYGLIKCVTVN